MRMNEGHALSLRAREEAAARAKRAQEWAARQTAKDRGPAPLVCPEGANAQQRAAFSAAAHEIAIRERSSKVACGWVRLPRTKAPAGCVPLCVLHGARTVILCIDARGSLRIDEGGKAGPAVTVSEAATMARG